MEENSLTIQQNTEIVAYDEAVYDRDKMARACEEVVFIPSKRVCLTVVEDLAKMQIPRNAEDAESVLAETQFNNKTIDDLLLQLQGYSIRPLLRDALKALKAA